MSILIKDDKTTGVQQGFVTVPGAEVIDLSQATVLPGHGFGDLPAEKAADENVEDAQGLSDDDVPF
jgi:hypothetical protein